MKTLKLIIAIALLLCLVPMPYGYYILIRYFAAILFGIMAYQYYRRKKEKLMIVFGALALLFQPIIKIPLGREMWNVVDVAVVVMLVVLLWKEKKQDKTVSEEQKAQGQEDQLAKYDETKANNPRLADIGSEFVVFISRLPSIKTLSDLNVLLLKFPDLLLDDRYVLDDYNPSEIGAIGANLHLYARLKTVEKPRDIDFVNVGTGRYWIGLDVLQKRYKECPSPELKAKLDEWKEVKRKPLPEAEDPFKHITLPFTEEAIWQAYLLKQTNYLTGSYCDGLYEQRVFINKFEDIDSINGVWSVEELHYINKFKIKAKECWSDDMRPLVILDGDKGYISHYWFDYWKGLRQVKCWVDYNHNSHKVTHFFIEEYAPVVPYRCADAWGKSSIRYKEVWEEST